MVLFVEDTQNAGMKPGLFQFETVVSNIKKLIATARENKIEVIYIRHDSGFGSNSTKGEVGFEVYDELKPAPGERIFDKKFCCAFLNTGLLEYLNEIGETQVVITGLMTEYCIDATIKSGFEHGLEMIVPANSNSTYGNDYLSAEQTYHFFNDYNWGPYAKCMSLEETLKLMK